MPRPTNYSMIQKVARRRAKGMSFRKIAKELKTDPKSVWRWHEQIYKLKKNHG